MTLVRQAAPSEIAASSGSEPEVLIDGMECWTSAEKIITIIGTVGIMMYLVSTWWIAGEVAETVCMVCSLRSSKRLGKARLEAPRWDVRARFGPQSAVQESATAPVCRSAVVQSDRLLIHYFDIVCRIDLDARFITRHVGHACKSQAAAAHFVSLVFSCLCVKS